MITNIGGDEVVLVIVPRGTHHQALKHNIDLQLLALTAIVDRVRSAAIANQMLDRTQMRFGQRRLNAE
jgi:hypothetical protein